jgi:lactate racemase
MANIQLRYGRTYIPFEYDPDRFDVLSARGDSSSLTDVELGERLDSQIGTDRLEEIVEPGESVLMVVPDATREAGAGQIVNLLVRRLIANGTMPHDIRAIVATGIHRKATRAEKDQILTPFITQRIKVLDHDAMSILNRVSVGETSGGIKVELNRALLEHDRVILVGGVNFHYFAGFTGGRKLVCPGLAGRSTIAATHRLAFDCEAMGRRAGVGTGLLDGNAVHEAFLEAASKVQVAFCVSTVVNDAGEVTDLHCGDLIRSHRAACEAFAAKNTVEIPEKRDLVIASCGGDPHDLNMIQAHKTLEAAAQACSDGGTIILLAECPDGLGRDDFLQWFDAADSSALAGRLCEQYQVNGQTAWSLLRKSERFDVRLISALPAAAAERMRLTPMQSLARAVSKSKKEGRGYILPSGSKINVVCA